MALERGSGLPINTIQVHPSAPQRYNYHPYPEGIEEQFLQHWGKSSVKKLFFHSIYLINLANPEREKRNLGVRSLIYDLLYANRVHASGVIFHVGSLKDEPDETTGLDRCVEAIKEVLHETPSGSMLLLEVSAGSGKVIGSKVEQLNYIAEKIGRPERLGFALDTQHMWASGYDWQNKLEEITTNLEKHFGLQHIYAIHLNDSKTELGSRIDRHADLGEGTIGIETLERVVNHPKLQHIPIILETPCMRSTDLASKDVARLRQMLGLPATESPQPTLNE